MSSQFVLKRSQLVDATRQRRKKMEEIDPVFYDKKFSTTKYMLKYIVGASSDEIRQGQLQKVMKQREIADKEIAGVVDENFTNFNTSLARFATISNQLEETRGKLDEVHKRSTDGKNILSSKTKNLRELLLQKYEAKKVIEIINDIQYIEAAPSKIHLMMNEKNFLGAVTMFSKALDLVFSDRLVAFHAIIGIRNTLMECKQAIEDQLVQELQSIIYLKGAFTGLSKANQYSMTSIEHELSGDSSLDTEFDRLMLSTRRDASDNQTSSHSFAFDTGGGSSGAGASSSTTLSGGSGNSQNHLLAAVEAVKLLHREMEVIGTIKSMMENELNEVVIQISLICRNIFNSSSYTSFDNNFTEKKFGKHDHSLHFQTFIKLLFHVLRKISQRHYLVSLYFNSNGAQWNYGMQEVVQRICTLLEKVLEEYLVENEAAPAGSSSSSKQATATSSIATAAAIAAAAAAGDPNAPLFKLSLNKPKGMGGDGPNGALRLNLFRDFQGKLVEETHTRVCTPSVFHLPVVYEDLEVMSNDLQLFLPSTTTTTTTTGNGGLARTGGVSSSLASSVSVTVSSLLDSFLKQFVTKKWIPKVKSKAQQFLSLKNRNMTSASRLPIPSDTSYQPPSLDTLVLICDEIGEMMHKMPSHGTDLIAVLEATVLKWLEDCTAIVKDIRDPTINQKNVLSNVAISDLMASFHDYEGYQRAKGNVPVPFQQSKVFPVDTAATSTPSSVSSPPATPNGIVSAFDDASVLGRSRASNGLTSPLEQIFQKELDIELKYYDPDVWSNGTKGLLMDHSRIAMLAYMNSACDYVALYLQQVIEKASSRTSSMRHGSRSRSHHSSHRLLLGGVACNSLQATSWKCSSLADECLFFLRREIRLHSFYYLTQLTSQRFDMTEEQVTMAQDSVLSLNINLSAIEHAIQPYLSSHKMAFMFDALDALLANVLISNLQQMHGAVMTKGGVQQMLLNISSLHQGLTGMLYSYPMTGRTGVHFDHAKRYYQLLLLSETQLEIFVIENKKSYTPEAFRALWRVDTPHRVLAKGSVNKLDSNLR